MVSLGGLRLTSCLAWGSPGDLVPGLGGTLGNLVSSLGVSRYPRGRSGGLRVTSCPAWGSSAALVAGLEYPGGACPSGGGGRLGNRRPGRHRRRQGVSGRGRYPVINRAISGAGLLSQPPAPRRQRRARTHRAGRPPSDFRWLADGAVEWRRRVHDRVMPTDCCWRTGNG